MTESHDFGDSLHETKIENKEVFGTIFEKISGLEAAYNSITEQEKLSLFRMKNIDALYLIRSNVPFNHAVYPCFAQLVRIEEVDSPSGFLRSCIRQLLEIDADIAMLDSFAKANARKLNAVARSVDTNLLDLLQTIGFLLNTKLSQDTQKKSIPQLVHVLVVTAPELIRSLPATEEDSIRIIENILRLSVDMHCLREEHLIYSLRKEINSMSYSLRQCIPSIAAEDPDDGPMTLTIRANQLLSALDSLNVECAFVRPFNVTVPDVAFSLAYILKDITSNTVLFSKPSSVILEQRKVLNEMKIEGHYLLIDKRERIRQSLRSLLKEIKLISSQSSDDTVIASALNFRRLINRSLMRLDLIPEDLLCASVTEMMSRPPPSNSPSMIPGKFPFTAVAYPEDITYCLIETDLTTYDIDQHNKTLSDQSVLMDIETCQQSLERAMNELMQAHVLNEKFLFIKNWSSFLKEVPAFLEIYKQSGLDTTSVECLFGQILLESQFILKILREEKSIQLLYRPPQLILSRLSYFLKSLSQTLQVGFQYFSNQSFEQYSEFCSGWYQYFETAHSNIESILAEYSESVLSKFSETLDSFQRDLLQFNEICQPLNPYLPGYGLVEASFSALWETKQLAIVTSPFTQNNATATEHLLRFITTFPTYLMEISRKRSDYQVFMLLSAADIHLINLSRVYRLIKKHLSHEEHSQLIPIVDAAVSDLLSLPRLLRSIGSSHDCRNLIEPLLLARQRIIATLPPKPMHPVAKLLNDIISAIKPVQKYIADSPIKDSLQKYSSALESLASMCVIILPLYENSPPTKEESRAHAQDISYLLDEIRPLLSSNDTEFSTLKLILEQAVFELNPIEQNESAVYSSYSEFNFSSLRRSRRRQLRPSLSSDSLLQLVRVPTLVKRREPILVNVDGPVRYMPSGKRVTFDFSDPAPPPSSRLFSRMDFEMETIEEAIRVPSPIYQDVDKVPPPPFAGWSYEYLREVTNLNSFPPIEYPEGYQKSEIQKQMLAEPLQFEDLEPDSSIDALTAFKEIKNLYRHIQALMDPLVAIDFVEIHGEKLQKYGQATSAALKANIAPIEAAHASSQYNELVDAIKDAFEVFKRQESPKETLAQACELASLLCIAINSQTNKQGLDSLLNARFVSFASSLVSSLRVLGECDDLSSIVAALSTLEHALIITKSYEGVVKDTQVMVVYLALTDALESLIKFAHSCLEITDGSVSTDLDIDDDLTSDIEISKLHIYIGERYRRRLKETAHRSDTKLASLLRQNQSDINEVAAVINDNLRDQAYSIMKQLEDLSRVGEYGKVVGRRRFIASEYMEKVAKWLEEVGAGSAATSIRDTIDYLIKNADSPEQLDLLGTLDIVTEPNIENEYRELKHAKADGVYKLSDIRKAVAILSSQLESSTVPVICRTAAIVIKGLTSLPCGEGSLRNTVMKLAEFTLDSSLTEFIRETLIRDIRLSLEPIGRKLFICEVLENSEGRNFELICMQILRQAKYLKLINRKLHDEHSSYIGDAFGKSAEAIGMVLAAIKAETELNLRKHITQESLMELLFAVMDMVDVGECLQHRHVESLSYHIFFEGKRLSSLIHNIAQKIPIHIPSALQAKRRLFSLSENISFLARPITF